MHGTLRLRETHSGQLPVTGTLICPIGKDETALFQAVEGISRKVAFDTQQPFSNCFDFIIAVLEALKIAGYLSDADYLKFDQYYQEYQQAVHEKTDPQLLSLATTGSVYHHRQPRPLQTSTKAT
jgi:hypothetical protein